MPRIATHGLFALARVFAGVLHQIAILCVSSSFLTRNFARDITALSKILEWQFLLQIVVRNVKADRFAVL